MHNEKIGIMGGMGTAAGLYFAQQLIELNKVARRDADHAAFILYSDPHIPDRSDAYYNRAASPAPSVINGLEKLSGLGADFGVVICNTAHLFFDEIAAKVSLPLISMIESTGEHIADELPGSVIGLLATTATATSGLYAGCVERAGCRLVTPDAAHQALVQAAIFDPEHGIKSTGICAGPQALRWIEEVADRMRERDGITHLLLGCTELSFAVQSKQWAGLDIIDPVKLLALRCLSRVAQRNNIHTIGAHTRAAAPARRIA